MSEKRSDAVCRVLNKNAPADLAKRCWPGMEIFTEVIQGCKVMDPDDPKKVVPHTYHDDSYRYYNFRLQAAGDENRLLDFPLCQYYSQIGISGWDYAEGVARGVGLDFDDIIGHAKVGLNDEQLLEVLEALKKLPYVEIRRSTGGAGYHAWIWFPIDCLPVVTSRIEMKALARAVLARMSLDTGSHFEGKVDHLGDILWICSRRATPESRGLTLVKDAERPMTEWPRDFKEHIPVVTRKRQKTALNGTSIKESDEIERLNKNRRRVPLEDGHRRYMAAYEETGYYGYWNEDHGCYVCHTFALAKVNKVLKIVDGFETVSQGTNPLEPNCWMYPLPGGGWRVFRFNKGTPEAPIWDKSKSGWTTTVICLRPTFYKVAKSYKGIASAKGYIFSDPDNAKSVVKVYGETLRLPTWFDNRARPITITPTPSGLGISFPLRKGDNKPENKTDAYKAGWVEKGRTWITFLECETESQQPFDYEGFADDMVRHVVRKNKQDGLYIHSEKGWNNNQTKQIENFMVYKKVGMRLNDTLGWCAGNPWIRTALPFRPEEPGDRLWNLDGCQLAVQPADIAGPTPYWDRLFANWGRGLDDAVDADSWCVEHAIRSGSDYLMRWSATMIRYPERRLPMLAAYSPENNTGKSMMHEAQARYMTPNAYMLAEKAIKNRNGFDAELHGKVLCALDDIDLSADNGFYDSLKRWITNEWMNFGYKGKEVFMDTNYTHWIIAVNSEKYIPMSQGDERTTLWEMTPFPQNEFIAKQELFALLEKEHAFLLRKLYDLDISEVHSRLALPPLKTAEKVAVMLQCEQFGLHRHREGPRRCHRKDGQALGTGQCFRVVQGAG